MKCQWSNVVLLALVFGVMVVGLGAEKAVAGLTNPIGFSVMNPINESSLMTSRPLFRTASNIEDFEFVGHLGGETRAVTVQGNYAYIGEGPSLTILNISDRTSPLLSGRATNLRKNAVVSSIVVKGSLAYVADGTGLSIIDINNPRAPIEIGYHEVPGGAFSVAVDRDYAYVALSGFSSSEFDLRIINVADPTTPYETAAYNQEGGNGGFIRSMTVDGGYIYFADTHGTLLVINVMDPKAPYLSDAVVCNGPCTDVAVKDEFAYVAYRDGHVGVFDISNPTAVSLHPVGGFGITDGIIESIALEGNHAYIGTVPYYHDGQVKLFIVDITDPRSPYEVGSYTAVVGDAVELVDVAIEQGYAYLTALRGTVIIDVADPATPHETSFYRTGLRPLQLAASGDFAYVSDWGLQGLHIINITDPTTPINIGLSETSLWLDTGSMVVANDHIYMPARSDGLSILDITNPTSPKNVGLYDTPGEAVGVTVVGNLAYVADRTGGMRIINIADPASPIEIGFSEAPGDAHSVAVVGNLAYIADRRGGMRIINIADPAYPTEIGFYDPPWDVYTVPVVVGHYAYLYDGTGLSIISVANPSEPVKVGHYYTEGPIKALDGTYAYIVNRDGGLQILNLSNPVSPTEVSFYDLGLQVGDVVVSGSYTIITDRWDKGLYIFRFTHEEQSYSISGRVTTQSGTPIPGVVIGTDAGSSTTDADGSYTITDLSAGTYDIGATLPGYSFAPSTRSVIVPPDAASQDFVGTPDAMTDTDRDGLLDDWEINGYHHDNGDIVNLPAMGANAFKPDIFVEVDWMEGHKPKDDAIRRIVDSFANAPVYDEADNQIGTGINLHVDVGPDSIDYGRDEPRAWGENGRGNKLDKYINHIPDSELRAITEQIQDGNFDQARRSIFHYSIWANKYDDQRLLTRGAGGVSLAVWGMPVFYVTLGTFSDGVGSVNEQAGTFMHELGHNLGLNHGGAQVDDADKDYFNFKPNYLSVMNYSFVTGGLIIDGDDGCESCFDYSRFLLPNLNEAILIESKGLGFPDTVTQSYGTKYFAGFPPENRRCFPAGRDTTFVLFTTVENAAGGINWNCSFLPPHIETSPVQEDINGRGGDSQLLTGYNDWANLNFSYAHTAVRGRSALISAFQVGDLSLLPQEITSDIDKTIPRLSESRVQLYAFVDSPTATLHEILTYTVGAYTVDANSIDDFSPQFLMPPGFTYVPGSSTGVLTLEPEISGQELTWPPIAIPLGGSSVEFSFQVQVGTGQGLFFAAVHGTSNMGLVFPEDQVAPVQVGGVLFLPLVVEN